MPVGGQVLVGGGVLGGILVNVRVGPGVLVIVGVRVPVPVNVGDGFVLRKTDRLWLTAFATTRSGNESSSTRVSRMARGPRPTQQPARISPSAEHRSTGQGSFDMNVPLPIP